MDKLEPCPLSSLNPRWVKPDAVKAPVPIYIGLSFDCPCCRAQRLSVTFRQAIDPQGMLSDTGWGPAGIAWDRQGDTFETLTLLPSIDFSGRGHWHGHITNGEVTQ